MFPDRNQQTFGFASDKNGNTNSNENKSAKKAVVGVASSSISVPNSGNNTPQRRSSVTGVGIGRRMISSASSRSSSVENILPSQYATTDKKQTLSARRSLNNAASGVPLTGNIINTTISTVVNKGRSSSNTNNSTNMSGCLNDGISSTHNKEDIRYVPRKKIVGGNNNTPSKGNMKF